MEDIKIFKKLSLLQAETLLSNLSPGWLISKEGFLEREYSFHDFARAIVFVNKIVNPIEEHESYPKITITYNRVTASLFTHETGSLTESDFKMAAEFDELFGLRKIEDNQSFKNTEDDPGIDSNGNNEDLIKV